MTVTEDAALPQSSTKHPGRQSAPRPYLLTVNGGSSSLKFSVFAPGARPVRDEAGRIERIGLPGARLVMAGDSGERAGTQPVDAPNLEAAARLLIDWVRRTLGPGSL